MRTVLILWAITAIVAIFGWELAFHRGDTINTLKTENNALKMEKSKYETYIQNAEIKNAEDSETIRKLREQAKKPVSVCDCYNSLADSNVINVLHSHSKK